MTPPPLGLTYWYVASFRLFVIQLLSDLSPVTELGGRVVYLVIFVVYIVNPNIYLDFNYVKNAIPSTFATPMYVGRSLIIITTYLSQRSIH